MRVRQHGQGHGEVDTSTLAAAHLRALLSQLRLHLYACKQQQQVAFEARQPEDRSQPLDGGRRIRLHQLTRGRRSLRPGIACQANCHRGEGLRQVLLVLPLPRNGVDGGLHHRVIVTMGPLNLGGVPAISTTLVTPSTVRRPSSGPAGKVLGKVKLSELLLFPVNGSAIAVAENRVAGGTGGFVSLSDNVTLWPSQTLGVKFTVTV